MSNQCPASPHSSLTEPAGSTTGLWLHKAIKGALCLNTFVFKGFLWVPLHLYPLCWAVRFTTVSSPGEVSCTQNSHSCPSWVRGQADLYTSGCWKIQRSTQKLHSNEDSPFSGNTESVNNQHSRIYVWNIIFLKVCHKWSSERRDGMLSKSVQQEEYFLGNKVKILAFNWVRMGQINEVSAPSQTSIGETWEGGCINSTSIHGTGQQDRKPNLQFQSFIQLWHRKVNWCLNNASEQIMLIKCLHSNLITQCNKFAFFTNTEHLAWSTKLGVQTLMSNGSIHGSF